VNNQFNADELIKVGGKSYPVVGGRLRLAHEGNKALSIETNVIYQDSDKTTIQAKVTTDKGTYNGLGNATVTRDAKLRNAILELAETRAIARALRFAGYGVEFTGFEEMPREQEEPKNKKQTLPKELVKDLKRMDGIIKEGEYELNNGYEDNIKPSKIQLNALMDMAIKKGVDLSVLGKLETGKPSKEWAMLDYYNVKRIIDPMPDIA